ncbi:formate dehydrogenase (NAD+) [Martiniozyma asiatica (nom. inval.)]|nr:formate dehydrogenase (NAD+) [Martiniozyma asiatica]
MTFADSKEHFKVLRLGQINFAHDAWNDLLSNPQIELVESPCQTKAEFIAELKSGLYSDVNYITRTYQSAKFTGLFDREILTLIKNHTKVLAISHTGAGYDQVDALACKDLAIQLSNVPGKVDDATADTNVFLILTCMRNFQSGRENLLKGLWGDDEAAKSAGTPYGHNMRDATIGIVGMGGIGKTVRDRLVSFGSKIVYYNRKRLSEEEEKGAKYCETIEELCQISDVISLNLPLNANTKHIINEKLIGMMKDGVIIVNTARGPVIDEHALKPALKSGKVAWLGTDVFENEPFIDMELARMDNVVALPHMGTHTVECLKSMEELVVENVQTYFDTGKVKTLVAELKELF